MKQKRLFIVLMFVTILGIIHPMVLDSTYSVNPPYSSISHPAIYISGNSALDLFSNKTGSGTKIDPYIIEDLIIDCKDEWISAIKILYTDRFLVLRNLTITRSIGSWWDVDGGIALICCANVNITQCYFTLNRFSTRLATVSNCYVYNNTSHDNYSGLYASDPTDDVYFFNNTCYNNYEGIHVDGGDYVEIYDNTLFRNDLGVYILYGEFFEVRDNTIFDSISGISLRENRNTHMFNNTIQNCTYGLDLFDTLINIFGNNSLIENDIGIKYNSSSYNANLGNIHIGNIINISEWNSEQNDLTGKLHSKISLDGNAQLAAFQNKTGNGTQIDPYIINNLVIDSKRVGSPIELHHITDYVILRNLIVTGAHHDYDQSDGGIELYQCENINITGCYFVRNEFGVHLNNNSNCNIFNNTAAYNWQHGIYSRGGYNIQIFNNSLHNGYNGVHLDGDNRISIYNNHIFENKNGLKLPYSDNSRVFENNISENSELGIWIHVCTKSRIFNNNLTQNGFFGIYLYSSQFNTIEFNTITNSNYGVYFNGSSYNSIKDNYFSGNFVDIDKENSINNSETIIFHPRIKINGNTELDSFENKTGTGTIEDPYVISNLYIDAEWQDSAIEIQNTNRFLIFDGIVATKAGGDWEGAVFITSCVNVQVKNCNLFRNDVGIIIDHSDLCEATNNSLFENWGIGISTGYSDEIIIENNSVITSGIGINLDTSTYIQVNSNFISNTYFWEDQFGIYLYSSSENTITNNYIENTDNGIILNEISSFNTISSNNITDNRISGIILSISCNYNMIKQNHISNQEHGIRLVDSNYNTIEENVISNNIYGIFMESSNNNDINYNHMINNEINIEQIESSGNRIRRIIDWVKFSLWGSIGTLGVSSVIFFSIYFPIRKKNAPLRHLKKSLVYISEENYMKALEFIELVLSTQKMNEFAINKKLLILYELGRFNEMLECLDNAKKKNTKFKISPEIAEKMDRIQVRDYIDKAMSEIDQ